MAKTITEIELKTNCFIK